MGLSAPASSFLRERIPGQSRTCSYVLSSLLLSPRALQATFMHLNNHFPQCGDCVTSPGKLPQTVQIPTSPASAMTPAPPFLRLQRRGSSNDLGSYAWTVCRQDQGSLRHQQLGGTFCSELSAWATHGHLAWLLKVAESKSYKTGIR